LWWEGEKPRQGSTRRAAPQDAGAQRRRPEGVRPVAESIPPSPPNDKAAFGRFCCLWWEGEKPRQGSTRRAAPQDGRATRKEAPLPPLKLSSWVVKRCTPFCSDLAVWNRSEPCGCKGLRRFIRAGYYTPSATRDLP